LSFIYSYIFSFLFIAHNFSYAASVQPIDCTFNSSVRPKSGTTRTCVAFSASAITLGIWEGIFGRVTELPEQHYERLLYIRKHYGATRTEEPCCLLSCSNTRSLASCISLSF
jgi:hypothetical protein